MRRQTEKRKRKDGTKKIRREEGSVDKTKKKGKRKWNKLRKEKRRRVRGREV